METIESAASMTIQDLADAIKAMETTDVIKSYVSAHELVYSIPENMKSFTKIVELLIKVQKIEADGSEGYKLVRHFQVIMDICIAVLQERGVGIACLPIGLKDLVPDNASVITVDSNGQATVQNTENTSTKRVLH